MDSDDDICVLQYSDEDIDIDASSHLSPSFPFSPFAPASANQNLDQGSHEALKIAFLTLTDKLTESKAQNQQLAQRVRELESSRPGGGGDLDSFVNIGESFDMMEDARYVATEGGAGSQLTQDMFVGAGGEALTANNMRQQVVPIATKVEGVDARNVQYKGERLPDKNQALGSVNQQVARLRQENARLQQSWEAERAEKERALQSLRDVQQRCSSLQLERDRALKEGASLHASLQKANQEVSILKEGGGGEGGGSEPPLELVNELVHMRKVIDKLKAMVLMQKDCLVNQSMTASMRSSLTRSHRDAPSMEPQSAPPGGGGSHSGGHSWEMVNGAPSLSAAAAESQRQIQQQRTPTTTTAQGGMTAGGGNALTQQHYSHQNGRASPQQPRSGPPLGQKLRSEGIVRRHSEVNVQKAAGKLEVTRAHTLPQPQQQQHQAPRLADWMSSHYQHKKQQQGQGRGGEGALGAVGLNQFMHDTPPPGPSPAPGRTEAGQAVSPRHVGAQYSSTSAAALYYPQRQQSPLGQPESTYDNIAYTTVATASSSSSTQGGIVNTQGGIVSTPGGIVNTQGSVVPPMHILNQSSMTGARVLQSGSSAVTSATPAPTTLQQQQQQQPAIVVGMGRDGDGAGGRGLPQEHSDVTQPHNPTDLELSPIRFVNQPQTPAGSASTSDRKCPVCGQDFSHITMDEFQTHVFECFDDAEDTSNAPDTLQPQQGGQRSSDSHDRVCPMCQKSFAVSISQDFFVSHVQSHFEDVVDHFEVLEGHRT